MSKEENAINRLKVFLEDIKNERLEVYGVSNFQTKVVNIGSGVFFEIQYYENSDEIAQAIFKAGDVKIFLDYPEIQILSSIF